MSHRGGHRPPAQGKVELLREYTEALSDLDGFERVWLIFCFDRSEGYRLRLVPRSDTVERGLFATRAPHRINPIGLTAVRLLAVEGNVLTVEGVDMLDKTPLLDIKPYIPRSDSHPDARTGWLEHVRRD